jgi:hypothetical protein
MHPHSAVIALAVVVKKIGGGSSDADVSLASCAYQEQNIASIFSPPIFDTNISPIGGLLSRPIFNAVAFSPSAAFVPLLGVLRAVNWTPPLSWKPPLHLIPTQYLPSSLKTFMGSNKLNGHRHTRSPAVPTCLSTAARDGIKHLASSPPIRGVIQGAAVYRCDPPLDPRRRLVLRAVAQGFFFYRWSRDAGPSDLS